MGKTLNEIAQELKKAKHKTKAKEEKEYDVKIHIIYAFNGTGKTRLSNEFVELINNLSSGQFTSEDKVEQDADKLEDYSDEAKRKILYYNAFTEELFYWDNHDKLKLNIYPNDFTNWILVNQGQDREVIDIFQHYTNSKLMPRFNEKHIKKIDGRDVVIPAFTEVTFSYERGNDEPSQNIKISKGEESCFIWSIFYALITQIIAVLEDEVGNRETNDYDDLEYVFIDDPVTSLDDNHLIEFAVDLAQQIKKNKSNLKFIITTHNPLFFNVLFNEFKGREYKKYTLKKELDGKYELSQQNDDSPFAYHLFLKKELENAVYNDRVEKYHLNFLRNILEKTATFLGYTNWGTLLESDTSNRPAKQLIRAINVSSHSKHAGYEAREAIPTIKEILEDTLKLLNETYKFK